MVPILAALLLGSCSHSAPEPQTQPGSVTVTDRLSNPDVRCFGEDSHGRMWIGTERGLNRYNGYDFHHYLNTPDSTSIPDNRIYDICTDRAGRLWVGTETGVAMYNGDNSFRRFPIDSDEKAVYQVLCDRRGRVILNMMEDLCVLDTASRRFVNVNPAFDRFYSYHSRCYIDSGNLLWVVAPREIRCFDPDAGFENLDNWPCLHFVTESVLLPNGQLWMTGHGRVSVFDTRRGVFVKPPASLADALAGREVEILWDAGDGRLLFKTADGSFLLADSDGTEASTTDISDLGLPPGFDIKTLYKDSLGDVWAGSDDKGFRFYPSSQDIFSPRSNGIRQLEGKSVASMSLAPDGRLWLFTRHDGLYLLDPASGAVEHPDLSALERKDRTDYLQTNEPLVYATRSSDLWLSLPNQQRLVLCSFDGKSLKVKGDYHAFYPRTAIEDKDGGMWFGTRNEFLVHIPPGGAGPERVQIYPYRTTFINTLALAGDDILIGAYDNDLMLLNPRSGMMSGVSILGGEGSRARNGGLFDPTSSVSGRDGTVWIGTRSDGILRYNPVQKAFEPVPGSPSGEILSLVEDLQGRLWAGTVDGISVLDPATGQFSDYLPPQLGVGVTFHERSAARLPDGRLAFGGTHGLTLIDPAEESAHTSARLVFEDLKVHNSLTRSLTDGHDIVLGHNSNSFSITFAVPDFRNIRRIRYSYRLEGFDREWVETGSAHEAWFAGVPAGRYTLRVRYSLQPDGSSFGEDSIRIRIKPAPWLSPFAISFYALLTILLGWFLWSVLRRLAQERAAARKARLDKEQEARVNRMNMTFFSNISHEFRTPLTMISGPVAELSRSGRLNGEDRRLLDIVQRSVGRMLSLVNQLLDLGKMENATLTLKVRRADIVPVIRDTAEIFLLNARSQGVALELKGLEYPLVTWFDEDKVVKILSNLLSNALKYTPSGGTVCVELDQTAADVKIAVSDTGPGIPEDQREKIFERYYQLQDGGRFNYGTGIGLYYSRNLAAIHHGSLAASGREDGGSGAVFTLLLPSSEDAYSPQERVPEELPVAGEYPLETVPSEAQAPAPSEELPLLLAVDDDPDILRYLQALFAGQYRVLTASGADEALQKAAAQSPDIVLSDVAMPGKDGFELCRSLKSNLQLSHIPVILVTAMGTVQNQVHGLDIGADAYVTKPFDPDYLRALVKSQLENRQRVRSILNAATQGSEVEDTLTARDRAFMEELYSLMEKELGNEDLDVAHLTEMLRMSRTKFYYKIKGLTGKTPSEFFMQYKLNMAAKMLMEGKWNVSEIAIKTGFNTLPHFSKAFKKQFGVSPSKYEG